VERGPHNVYPHHHPHRQRDRDWRSSRWRRNSKRERSGRHVPAATPADGITVTNAADVIKGAHDFCDALAQGASSSQIIQDLVSTGKFDQSDAKNILNASVAVYCQNP